MKKLKHSKSQLILSMVMNWLSKDLLLFVTSSVIFSLYVVTISNSIAGGDAGEIVAEGCQLGTGYPLITLLIYALTKIPTDIIGKLTIAYRVNVFCSFCTSLACFFIGKVIHIFCEDDISASIFGMSMFAFSPLIWQYAITAEVFALNTLFTSIIVYLVGVFSTNKKLRTVYLGSFICGLALCNQHSIVLYEIPLILWMLYLTRNAIIRRPIILVYLSFMFLTGLLPYIYLPIAAILKPTAGSWGTVNSISGFLHHFLRRDYGTFQLYSGINEIEVEGLWERNHAYLLDIVTQFGDLYIPTLFMTMLGILYSIYLSFNNKEKLRSNQVINKATPLADSKKVRIVSFNEDDIVDSKEIQYTPAIYIFTQVFYLYVFHSLSNMSLKNKLLYGVHQRFWMQPNVLIFIWSGIGFFVLKKMISKIIVNVVKISSQQPLSKIKLKNKNTGPHSFSLLEHFSLFGNLTSIVLAFIVLLIQFRKFHPFLDMSPHEHFRNYASAILSPLPLNSVLLVNYDQQWTSVRYLQVCEGYRNDITAIQLSMMTYKWFSDKHKLYPNLTFPGSYYTFEGSKAHKQDGAFTLKEFINKNIQKQNIFLAVPVGLVSQFYSLKVPIIATSYLESQLLNSWPVVLKYLSIENLPNEKQFPEETWEWTIARDFKDRITDTAAFLLEKAIETTDSKPLIEAAYWLESVYLLEQSEKSISASHLLKNAGIAYMHLVRRELLSLPLPERDLFETIVNKKITWPIEDKNWKAWAASRFIFFWGQFLKHPNAKHDPQYDTIKKTYDTVSKKK